MLRDIDFVGDLTLEGKRISLAGCMLLGPLLVARASTNKGSEMEAWINRRFEFIDCEMGIFLQTTSLTDALDFLAFD